MKKPLKIVAITVVAVSIGYAVYRFVHNPEAGAPDDAPPGGTCSPNAPARRLLGSNVFYFGASNTIGPGSDGAKKSDESLRLRFELSELEPDAVKRSGAI